MIFASIPSQPSTAQSNPCGSKTLRIKFISAFWESPINLSSCTEEQWNFLAKFPSSVSMEDSHLP